MGDTHFILRHALTGSVFLLFFALGCWAADPEFMRRVLAGAALDDVGDILTLAVSSALIGVTIQGIHIGWLHCRRRNFKDRARRIVAEEMKKLAFRFVGPEDWRRVERAAPDSFFVWLYHRLAPNDLIEWARRRRSYYYLGINWALACGAGWLSGIVWRLGPHPSHLILVFIAMAASLVWSVVAWALAIRMRRDADEMEFLWALARVNPDLREALAAALSLQDDTQLSGAIEVTIPGRRKRGGSPPGA